jgi:hypothetical protein
MMADGVRRSRRFGRSDSFTATKTSISFNELNEKINEKIRMLNASP